MLPFISLIIAVYNKPDILSKVLISINNQTFRDFEIIIADDGSDESVARVIEKYRSTFKTAIKHIWHEKKGFRKTIIVNKAVANACGEYLVFIDGDCILHHRYLERHYIHRMPRTVLAGRRVTLSETATKRLTYEDVSSRHIESIRFWWNGCLRGQRKHGFFIPFSFVVENWFKKRYWILGSNFSIYRTDFESINGYDETITGRGGEDIDLTARVRMARMKIKTITREALQYHLFHTSDPIPHDSKAFEKFNNPLSAWAPIGIRKNSNHSYTSIKPTT